MDVGLLPLALPETQAFWDGAARGDLMLPSCDSCGRAHFYPRALCPFCLSTAITWTKASGRGQLTSYVINHLPTPPFASDVLQIIALVTLDEGVRLMSNVVDVNPDPAELVIGMPLSVSFFERDGQHLPVFEPRWESAS